MYQRFRFLALFLSSLFYLILLLAACGDMSATASPPTTTVAATTSVAVTTAALTTSATVATPTSVATTSAPIATTARPTLPIIKAAELPEGRAQRFDKTIDDLKIEVAVAPGIIGKNKYIVRLSQTNGQAITEARIRVEATHLEMDMGIAKLELQPVGPDKPGLYQGEDYLMSMYGKFKMEIFVQRLDQSEAVATFEINVITSK